MTTKSTEKYDDTVITTQVFDPHYDERWIHDRDGFLKLASSVVGMFDHAPHTPIPTKMLPNAVFVIAHKRTNDNNIDVKNTNMNYLLSPEVNEAGDAAGAVIMGYITVLMNPPEKLVVHEQVYILSVVVAASYRRRGIAERLLKAAQTHIAQQYPQTKRMRLHVRVDEDEIRHSISNSNVRPSTTNAALELYKKFHFSVRKTCWNYFGKGIHALEMIASLPTASQSGSRDPARLKRLRASPES